MGDETVYKLFLSSPSDVAAERDVAMRVVRRLNAERIGAPQIEMLRWEDSYYTATSTFQEQIEEPGDCDLVVCLFWKSLGSDLPEGYRTEDGRLPTGTEYEFENALNRSLGSANRQPDVLVYRKTADIFFKSDTVAIEQAQQERLLSFWQRWFQNEKGHFVAGFHTFKETSVFERLFEDHLRQWLERREASAVYKGGAPYIGLRPFGPEEAGIFFGRDHEIQRARARLVANALNGRNVLAIVGPSGSGKSSLVLAGLMPRLAETRLTADRSVLSTQLTLRPSALVAEDGTGWATGFAQVLLSAASLGEELGRGDFAEPSALAALLNQTNETSVQPVSRALDRLATTKEAPQGLLIFVDQLEEIFAFAPENRDALALTLAQFAKDDRIHLLMTMRSEFLASVQECAPLSALFGLDEVSDGTEPILMLKPPRPADLRDIIARPAAYAGLSFERSNNLHPALDQRIEADAAEAPLPALQFLLAELYADRDETTLTHESYDRLGGVAGVIARRGDAALDRLGTQERDAFPGLARKLVVTDSLTDTVVSRAATRATLTDTEEKVVAALVEDGLLISEEDDVRLAHEVLITGWGTLADVIEDDRRLLSVRHRLSLAAMTHEALGKRSKTEAATALLQGFPLAEGRDLLSAWDEDAISAEFAGLPAFIRASIRSERSRGRNRRAAIGLAATFVVAATFAGAFLQLRSIEAESRAELGAAIANASEAALRYEDWPSAVREARRARELADTSATLSLALSVVLGADVPFKKPFGNQAFQSAVLGYDGKLRFSQWADGQTSVGNENTSANLPDQANAAGFMLSTNALVSVSRNGRVWYQAQETDGQWLNDFDGPGGVSAFFAEDATHFTVAVSGTAPTTQTAYLLTCEKTQINDCKSRDLSNGETIVLPAADGATWVTGARSDSERKWLKIWSSEGEAKEFGHSTLPDVFDLALVNDAQSLVWGTRDGAVYFSRDFSKSRQLFPSGGARAPAKVASSVDGSKLAYTCGDEVICLAQVSGDRVTLTHKVHSATGGVQRLSMSPTGERVLVQLADGSVRLWSVDAVAGPVDIFPILSQSRMDHFAVSSKTGALLAFFASNTPRLRNFNARTDAAEVPIPIEEVPRSTGRIASLGINENLERFLPVAHSASDGRGLVASSFRSSNVVWLFSEPKRAHTFIDFANPPHRLAFAPNGDLLATSAFALERHTIEGVAETLVTKPEGLGIGGVTAHGDTIYYSLSNGGLMAYEREAPVVPLADSADTLGPLSLDVHPDGRFLVATRADNKVLVHDLEKKLPPARLDIPTIDSKVVEFSPSGDHVAVLTTAGGLGVWRFDTTNGTAEPHFFVDPVPPALKINPQSLGAKAANWMTWTDDETIAVASESGDAILISIDPEKIDAELAVMDEVYDQDRVD